MRLLILLLLVAIVVMVIWALRRRAQAGAGSGAAGDHYRVVQTASGSDAHVSIARSARDSKVLIGSVPINSEDFDERYAQLLFQAEDRAATLNASRQLHADS